MKTTDLPIGSHVAWDRYDGRSHHSFTEAFVMAHRPKGHKSARWGGTNGNTDTVGIASKSLWYKDEDGRPVWEYNWVRPVSIHYLWSDYEAFVEKQKETKIYWDGVRREEKENRTHKFNALPKPVQEMIPDYQRDYLLDKNSTSIYITLEWLEKMVEAVRLG